MQIRERIKTYATFFREQRRFRRDFICDNTLADSYEGTTEVPKPANVSVCLRSPTNRHLVFYKEDCASVGMDLSEMPDNQPTVAVDTRREYSEIDLVVLSPGKHQWGAPCESDWAVAVGQYE